MGLCAGALLFMRADSLGAARAERSTETFLAPRPPPQDSSSTETPLKPLMGEQLIFSGACDASGAVPIDRNTLAVADDEDNIIRIYDVRTGGAPLRTLNVAPTVPTTPEADIEAATRIDDEAFWLGSHGRGKSGRLRSERLVLLGTRLPGLEGDLEVVGEPYQGLLGSLMEQKDYAPLDLRGASERSATAPGGLNFEGMTSTDRGSLLLGFRSPVPHGKALVAELLNPSEVLWGDAPSFSPPLLLSLGGKGIRSLSSWRGDYLIVAGPRDYGTSKLYRWRGPGFEPSYVEVDFTGLNPEAFFTPEDREEILLISDDGTNLINGEPCKKLADPEQKYFRAVWISLKAVPRD